MLAPDDPHPTTNHSGPGTGCSDWLGLGCVPILLLGAEGERGAVPLQHRGRFSEEGRWQSEG